MKENSFGCTASDKDLEEDYQDLQTPTLSPNTFRPNKQHVEFTPQSPINRDLTSAFRFIVENLLAFEHKRLQLYNSPGFSLERLFRLVSNNQKSITLDSLTAYLSDQNQSSVKSIYHWLKRGDLNTEVNIRVFRRAVTPIASCTADLEMPDMFIEEVNQNYITRYTDDKMKQTEYSEEKILNRMQQVESEQRGHFTPDNGIKYSIVERDSPEVTHFNQHEADDDNKVRVKNEELFFSSNPNRLVNRNDKYKSPNQYYSGLPTQQNAMSVPLANEYTSVYNTNHVHNVQSTQTVADKQVQIITKRDSHDSDEPSVPSQISNINLERSPAKASTKYLSRFLVI